jgi:type I restriction enzyme S subunit
VIEADGELGELPEGWQWRRVAEVCEINPRRPKSFGLAATTLVPFVPMDAVDAASGIITGARLRPLNEVERGFTCFQNGDVIFAKITPCMENGKSALVTSLEGPCAFGSTEFLVLRPGPEIEGAFLLQIVRQQSFRNAAQNEMAGAVGQARVPVGFLANAMIPVPPRKEQRRLLATLAPMREEVDRQRLRLDRLRAVVGRTRRSVLAAAFRGELTSGWRQHHPAISDGATVLERILSERAGTFVNTAVAAKRPFKRPEIGIGDEESPSLPAAWTWAPLEALGEINLGKMRSPEFHSGPLMRPYLRVANVKSGGRIDLGSVLSMNFEPHEQEHFALRAGDIVLSEGQSLELVGQSAIFREGPDGLCFQKTLHRFRRWHSAPSSEFMQYVFSHYVQNGIFPRYASMTVNIAHLTLERLKPVPIPLPPLEEQQEIVRIIDRWFAVLDDVERRIARGLALCERLRESLLQKAFRGELLAPLGTTSLP